MKLFAILFMYCVANVSAQAPSTLPGSAVTSIRAVASDTVFVGILSGGITVTGVIDGQPVVLRDFKEKNPIAPGNYKIRLIHTEKPHGSELDQRYTLTLQDGKELTFYLEAVCDRAATVCYGVSVK